MKKKLSIIKKIKNTNESRMQCKLHVRIYWEIEKNVLFFLRCIGKGFFLFNQTMYFHGARFSNYEAWLSDPVHIKPSAQVVWPVVGQEILNGDVGGGFQGIQITSGFFQLWRASGITSELQLYTTAIGGLVMAAAMFFAGWFHYHKAAPKLEWFQNVESMLNHHLAGLLGLGSLSWAGHQIHVSLPVNKLLDAGVDPKEIPLPHEFLLNRQIMQDLYPSFAKGLAPFFTLQWGEYSDFLTFNGGLNPVTGGLWLSDTAHHHLAIAVLFLIAGHMYRTNWGIGHSMKEILEAHKGPFTGEGHVGLYEILTTSWHAQLAINLALFGSLSIIVAHHMYSMPPYPYLATDYGTQLSLFTHHNWIGGFCIVGAGAHAAIFMVRDYDPTNNYNNLLDRVIRHRDAIISHLNWVCIFLGFHSFGLTYSPHTVKRAVWKSLLIWEKTKKAAKKSSEQTYDIRHKLLCVAFQVNPMPSANFFSQPLSSKYGARQSCFYLLVTQSVTTK
jgi:photosystem I P700 chlorophyll a apoprotein A1